MASPHVHNLFLEFTFLYATYFLFFAFTFPCFYLQLFSLLLYCFFFNLDFVIHIFSLIHKSHVRLLTFLLICEAIIYFHLGFNL